MTDEQIIENWQRGWNEAIDYVLDISREMRQQYPFHDYDIATLSELEQRIV